MRHFIGRCGRAVCAAAALFSQAAAAGEAQAPQPPQPAAPLTSYLVSDDYPADALDKEEQGTVEFQLTVGVDGLPSDCVVTTSSGSSSLDSASCRIMMERARFRPARNSAGKPVVGTHVNRISWRMEESEPASPATETAVALWYACGVGEAAKLVTSQLAAGEIVSRAFAACAAQEQRVALEMTKSKVEDPPKAIAELKKEIGAKFPDQLARWRAALKGEAAK